MVLLGTQMKKVYMCFVWKKRTACKVCGINNTFFYFTGEKICRLCYNARRNSYKKLRSKS